MQGMLSVQVLLKKALPMLRVWLIHSDVVGNEDEDEIALPDADGQRVVALATIVGARTITLDSMRYAILHSAVRDEELRAAGISLLYDVRSKVTCAVGWPVSPLDWPRECMSQMIPNWLY